MEGKSLRLQDTSFSDKEASMGHDRTCERLNSDNNLQFSGFASNSGSDGNEGNAHFKDNDNGARNELLLLPP